MPTGTMKWEGGIVEGEQGSEKKGGTVVRRERGRILAAEHEAGGRPRAHR